MELAKILLERTNRADELSDFRIPIAYANNWYECEIPPRKADLILNFLTSEQYQSFRFRPTEKVYSSLLIKDCQKVVLPEYYD